MKRNCFTLLAACCAALVLPRDVHAAQTETPPLNLISIVTDDQAHWSLGCYGNKESRTPNMDRVAKEGAIFLNAFTATPVCSPSRVTFLTGRYGTQMGITDYLAPIESNAGIGLSPKAVTWPEVLQKHGYITGLVGKWHLGTQPQYHPKNHGFHHFYGFHGGGTTPMNPTFDHDGEPLKMQGSLPDLLVNNAIGFVTTNRSNPFALLLHFRAPHLPYGPVPPGDSAPFKKLDPTVPEPRGGNIEQIKNWTRDYYASIHSVDRNLGRLFKALEEFGLMDKTIILFTSDHGYNIGHHGIHTKGNGIWIAGGVNGPKRPNMWDTSVRVPLMVRWPGVVKPGTKVNEYVSNIDTFASVLGMLNVPKPRDWKHEGADFSTVLRGQRPTWRDTVFAQYDLHNNGLAYMRMVRTPKHKLVRHYHANMMDELYDLEKDPGEERNLMRPNASLDAELQRVVDDLDLRLLEWMESIDDPRLREVKQRQRERRGL
ncbi:MAG: sulfatase-like hydrolase/transferase [Verrucomicrobiota bacterium]